MPRILLEPEGSGVPIDLGDFLADTSSGAFAQAGITGFGLPPVEAFWAEGVGDGARYRGRRVQPRPIDLPIFVTGADRAELQQRMDHLAKALARPATLRVVEDDGTTSRSIEVVRIGGGDFATGEDHNGRHWLRTIVTLQAGEPFWKRDETIADEVTGTNADGTNSLTLDNTGSAPAFPRIEVTGPTLGFSVTDANGRGLTFSELVRTGEKITIDMADGSVVDDVGRNRYSALGPAPSFFSVEPGSSTISVKATNSGSAFNAAITAKRYNYVVNPVFGSDLSNWESTSWVRTAGSGDQSYMRSQPGSVATWARTYISGLTVEREYEWSLDIAQYADPDYYISPPTHTILLGEEPTRVWVTTPTNEMVTVVADPVPLRSSEEGLIFERVAFRFIAPTANVTFGLTVGRRQWFNGVFSTYKYRTVAIRRVFLGEPGEFFWGGKSSTPAETYSWEGTANASRSIATPVVNVNQTKVRVSLNPRDWLVV